MSPSQERTQARVYSTQGGVSCCTQLSEAHFQRCSKNILLLDLGWTWRKQSIDLDH